MLLLTVSAARVTALALSIASRRRGLADGSPPPGRAATLISRITRVQALPRFSSWRPLRCWMLAHLECPAMGDAQARRERTAILVARGATALFGSATLR